MDPKEPKDVDGGGEVISLDDARKKSGESETQPAPQTMTLNGAELLKPVMAAIARELASVADPDGVVRVGGSDEASRAKTAAVVKGLGIGLGQVLAEAFGKYAQKIETGQVTPPVTASVANEPPDGDDDEKKPS
ncbi:MAG TPA: hypothetical protein VHB97_00410 [Polyangia bacterium]|nr:hypothetical protein [Polyangia bacterium]